MLKWLGRRSKEVDIGGMAGDEAGSVRLHGAAAGNAGGDGGL